VREVCLSWEFEGLFKSQFRTASEISAEEKPGQIAPPGFAFKMEHFVLLNHINGDLSKHEVPFRIPRRIEPQAAYRRFEKQRQRPVKPPRRQETKIRRRSDSIAITRFAIVP
jgi:hypothetical protein